MMKSRHSIISCLLAGLLCTSAGYGQYKLDKPVIIDKEKGLPTDYVRSITKGADGFMWIATSEGLCRFDGQQVKVYRQEADPKTAPFDNMIYTLLTNKDEVWMGTGQGVSVLNTKTETFRHYQFDASGKTDSLSRQFDQSIASVYLDRQGDIWVGTRDRGLWQYDKQKDNFRNFPYPDSAYHKIIPSLAPNIAILSIEQSRLNDSIIWAGTPSGLQQVNKYSREVKWFTFPDNDKKHQVALNAFRRLCHQDNGLLYVGSWTAGINVFDPVKETFTPLPLTNDEGKESLQGTVSGIQRKSKDELWITTSEGLAVYNTSLQEVTWYKMDEPRNFEYYGVDYIDEKNRVWYTNNDGIRCFDPLQQQFSTYSFQHLFPFDWGYAFYIKSGLEGNTITVCPRVTDGLYILDKQRRQWTKSAFNGISSMGFDKLTVRGFETISPGNYLVSSDEGLFQYSVAAKKITPMPSQPSAAFRRWGDILKDSYGIFWLSADADGLIKWDTRNKSYRIYKKELLENENETGIGRTGNFFEDSRHNIWFSRYKGFSVYIRNRDTLLNFFYSRTPGISFPVINNFAEDKNGKLWVTSGDGWYGYIDANNPAGGIIKKFNLNEKGITVSLPYLATDADGNVWSYTDRNLVKINAGDLSVSTFSFEYGIDIADFFHFSFLPSGEMVFGGRNSITIVNPSELKRNTELPVPYIVQLRLMNRPFDISSRENNEPLRLGHRQNFISIYFSAKAYTMAQAVKLRYRLSGFDDWVETSSGRLANYTNIPPGNYVFQLQAANNEGLWNEKILEFPFHIVTPWWQTWWFQIGLVFFIAGLIYYIYLNRINQVKKKEKLKTQYEKKLANMEMTALLAQMNPHFLFNSLNSIDSYIIKNESGKASEYLNNFARLMRLILQNSRSNYTSLKDEIETLDLYMQMESLRFKDKFQYEIKEEGNLATSSIAIPPMLIQPYVENAIWHGLMHKKDGTPGKVKIIINQIENKLVIIIQDNGIGREKAAEIKAQKPGNQKRSMGMQITKDRIDLINKLYDTDTSVQIIDLKDPDGTASGTRVELIIPF